MSSPIPFPLRSRTALIRSIAADLETVHGPAANEFWRRRIAGIVSGLRDSGLPDDVIRSEIYDLQSAVQYEMQRRAGWSSSAM